MIGKLMKRSLVLCVFVIVFILGVVFGNAAYINPHGYIGYYIDGDGMGVKGGYFETPHGQEWLYSNWSVVHYNSFITNEMWLGFGAGYEWIELGDVDGSINGSYWYGHYVACEKYNSTTKKYVYSEYTVGNAGSTGRHSYETLFIGSNTWRTYVDGIKARDFTFSYTSGSTQTVGTETNDDQNYFVSNNYDDNLMYQSAINGLWYYWSSPTNMDDNTLNWWSVYSSIYNRIQLID